MKKAILLVILSLLLSLVPGVAEEGYEVGDDYGAEPTYSGSREEEIPPMDEGNDGYEEEPEYRDETPEYYDDAPEYRDETPEYPDETPEYPENTPEYPEETPQNVGEMPEGSGNDPVETPEQPSGEQVPASEAEIPSETPGESPEGAPGETPAGAPGETPAETPTETPSGTAEDAPADAPAGTPGETPAEPTGEATGEAAGEATGEAAGEATGEAAGETPAEGIPGLEGELPVTPEEPLPADAEDEYAEARTTIDGRVVYGSLQDIAGQLTGGETVYIRTDKLLHLEQVSLYRMAGVRFRPDREIFDEDYEVRVYEDDPDEGVVVKAADLSGASEGDYGELYVRVELRAAEESALQTAEQAADADSAVVITVDPASFPEGVWQTKRPEFKLSGLNKDSGWTYAVLIYDERFIPLSGNSYAPEMEGIYNLKFVAQDRLGDIRAVTNTIKAMLDWTAPKLTVTAVTDEDYAIDISATDATSGVQSLSVDAGGTWRPLENGETFRFTTTTKRTLLPGMIRVRDAAGNVTKSTKSYVLDKAKEDEEDKEDEEGEDSSEEKDEEEEESSEEKKSSSTSKKKLPHAANNGADASPYTLKLTLPNEPMRQLIVGGKAMDLTLMVEAEGERRPTSFTGRFTRWLAQEGDATAKLSTDTLMLEAALDMDRAEAFSCEWRFNGEVYRELADAGIKYIVFHVGDDYCALSTEGFTGGSKYTEFKMLGVSTRKFDYTLTMKLDQDANHFSAMTENDFSQDCDLSVSVEVENMSYALSNSPKSAMYYYNIYLGPEEMLQFPFGKYDV